MTTSAYRRRLLPAALSTLSLLALGAALAGPGAAFADNAGPATVTRVDTSGVTVRTTLIPPAGGAMQPAAAGAQGGTPQSG
ncbi:OmpA family protein, partial [Burkholderia gladioli]|nr:OmpA family protein [Burkholderia gladioli]